MQISRINLSFPTLLCPILLPIHSTLRALNPRILITLFQSVNTCFPFVLQCNFLITTYLYRKIIYSVTALIIFVMQKTTTSTLDGWIDFYLYLIRMVYVKFIKSQEVTRAHQVRFQTMLRLCKVFYAYQLLSLYLIFLKCIMVLISCERQ